jgi:hypothetical protein
MMLLVDGRTSMTNHEQDIDGEQLCAKLKKTLSVRVFDVKIESKHARCLESAGRGVVSGSHKE